MGANRNFVLPAPAIGDRVEVSIVDGNSTNELIIKGASGVKINKGTAATEWSRLFIAGETVTFVADATDNWQVLVDGRIPCIGTANDYGELVGTISAVDNPTDTITINGHGLTTGDAVFGVGSLPDVFGNTLNDTSITLYAINTGTNTFKLASTRANALAGTARTTSNTTTGGTVRKGPLFAYNTFQRVRHRNIVQNRGNVLQSGDKGVARRSGVYELFFICQMSDFVDTLAAGSHQASIANTDATGNTAFPNGGYTVANLFGQGRVVTQGSTTATLTAGNVVYWQSRHLVVDLTQSYQYQLQRPTVSMVEIL
jgi:hypothetical protein